MIKARFEFGHSEVAMGAGKRDCVKSRWMLGYTVT